MIGNKRLRVVGPSDDDYESARLDGLAETERFVIAVQSSAYLQLWDQRRLSRISFAGLRSHRLDPHAPGGVSPEVTYNADVYVFALQTAQSHDAYYPLDANQWEFYVLSRSTIEGWGAMSIGLRSLRSLAGGPTPYDRWQTPSRRRTLADVHGLGRHVPDRLQQHNPWHSDGPN